ncbi:MAG: hypothetical protein ACFBSG_07290 [Leptolyngbyaceae cyanobacterium]
MPTLHSLATLWKRSLARCLPAGWSLMLKLGGGGAIALSTLLTLPAVVQAYTARVVLFVPRAPGESYDTFLRQCEAIARAGVQRSFDADILTSEVVVTIVGENQGLAIPVMEVEVTREEWELSPDPVVWARYYNNASTLLEP